MVKAADCNSANTGSNPVQSSKSRWCSGNTSASKPEDARSIRARFAKFMRHPKTIAERRHQVKRVIKKRLRVVIEIWEIGMAMFGESHYIKEPHRLHKFNLNCGCGQCHYYKYAGNSSARFTHTERKQRLKAQEQYETI